MALSNEDFLVKKIAGNGDAAFEALYEHYFPLLYRLILKLLKSPALSEDLCQEVFLHVWETRANLQNINILQSYLLTVAKNKAFNILRRSSTEVLIKSEIVRNYPFTHNRVEDDLITGEYMEYLENILETLSPQSREVFRLCRQEGKSYDETASILRISKSAVKKHMVKTMDTMRTAVSTDLGVSLNFFMAIILSV